MAGIKEYERYIASYCIGSRASRESAAQKLDEMNCRFKCCLECNYERFTLWTVRDPTRLCLASTDYIKPGQVVTEYISWLEVLRQKPKYTISSIGFASWNQIPNSMRIFLCVCEFHPPNLNFTTILFFATAFE